MGSLEKFVQKTIDASRGKHGNRKAKAAAAEQLRKDEMFASGRMPDEEELRRSQRRIAARRRGSRAETVLTDTLG